MASTTLSLSLTLTLTLSLGRIAGWAWVVGARVGAREAHLPPYLPPYLAPYLAAGCWPVCLDGRQRVAMHMAVLRVAVVRVAGAAIACVASSTETASWCASLLRLRAAGCTERRARRYPPWTAYVASSACFPPHRRSAALCGRQVTTSSTLSTLLTYY